MDDENKFLFSQKIQTLEAFAQFFKSVFAASRPEITVEIVRGKNVIGLALMTGDKILSPMVRLDGLYDKYIGIGGYSLWKVFCEISSACDEYDSRNSTGIVVAIEDFELVRHRICFRLMNYERNKESWKQCRICAGSTWRLCCISPWRPMTVRGYIWQWMTH